MLGVNNQKLASGMCLLFTQNISVHYYRGVYILSAFPGWLCTLVERGCVWILISQPGAQYPLIVVYW